MPTLTQLILVEPGVYWRIFDLDYQAEQFEVFHRTALTRWAHYLGTPAIVCLLFVLIGGLRVGPAPATAILWALLSAWYLRMDARVGLVAAAEVAGLALLARTAVGWGAGPGFAVAGLALLALVQNVSHSVEPVPPVITGRGYEPFAVYWARASGVHRARLLALNLAYLPLELVSAPRLLAVHVLRALHALGWRRAWALDVRARADALLTAGA